MAGMGANNNINKKKFLIIITMKNIKKLVHSYVPAVTYSNAEIAKPQILLENNGKSGVYL